MMARAGCLRTPGRGIGGGFTLVEVLTALLIFSVAIVAYLQSMGLAIRTQGDLAERQRAAILAENILEEIATTGQTEEGTESGRFEGDDAMFWWETRVEATDLEGLAEVRVAVNWQRGPHENRYELTTMMELDETDLATRRRGPRRATGEAREGERR